MDRKKLSDLMYSSFGRRIKDSALEKAAYAFLEENYRGAALLEQHGSGWYLSKFAVDRQARGEGLAAEIWAELTADNPPLFWRARNTNPINHWYRRHADGFHDTDDWSIFWRNIDWHSIPEIIDYCIERPQDFRPDTN
jgi:acetylglutamate synthase